MHENSSPSKFPRRHLTCPSSPKVSQKLRQLRLVTQQKQQRISRIVSHLATISHVNDACEQNIQRIRLLSSDILKTKERVRQESFDRTFLNERNIQVLESLRKNKDHFKGVMQHMRHRRVSLQKQQLNDNIEIAKNERHYLHQQQKLNQSQVHQENSLKVQSRKISMQSRTLLSQSQNRTVLLSKVQPLSQLPSQKSILNNSRIRSGVK